MTLKYFSVALAPAILMLSACGGGSEVETPAKATKPVVEAAKEANKPETVVKPKPAASTEVSTEEAMLKRGRIVWFKCRSCHELDVDGPHKVGPNLHALMGATAGVKEGFVYSKPMADSGIVWDAETLDAFILKPTDYIKGTKMAFVGIKKESDRQALIKYIEENTK